MAKHVILGLGIVLLAAFLSLGCDKNVLAPYEPEINNAPDNFQFQATGMKGVTYSKTFSWQNTGDSATVDQSPSEKLNGVAALTVVDPGGTTVYSGDLAADGAFGTDLGAAGTWTVRVTFASVTGTVNFRVQKAS